MPPKLTLSRGRTAFYCSVAALLLVGCDGGTIIVVDSCFGVAVLVGPHRAVVSVGERVPLDANFSSPECVPAGITTEEWRWSSRDTLIARIDSLTGLAEGVGPGKVIIDVHHAQTSEVVSSTGLTVVARRLASRIPHRPRHHQQRLLRGTELMTGGLTHLPAQSWLTMFLKARIGSRMQVPGCIPGWDVPLPSGFQQQTAFTTRMNRRFRQLGSKRVTSAI